MKWELVIPFLLLIAILAIIPIIPFIGARSTGVCIFKGPAIIGFFTNSDGIPLRGIGVTAWRPGGFGGQIIDAAGPTDRTGCFIFKANMKEFVSYNYNGTSYIDQVDAGVILRDNLP